VRSCGHPPLRTLGCTFQDGPCRPDVLCHCGTQDASALRGRDRNRRRPKWACHPSLMHCRSPGNSPPSLGGSPVVLDRSQDRSLPAHPWSGCPTSASGRQTRTFICPPWAGLPFSDCMMAASLSPPRT
jgi:hypothetical protein